MKFRILELSNLKNFKRAFGPFLVTKIKAFGPFLETPKRALLKVKGIECLFLSSQKWTECLLCDMDAHMPNAHTVGNVKI